MLRRLRKHWLNPYLHSSGEASESLESAGKSSARLQENADALDEQSQSSTQAVRDLEQFTEGLVDLMNEQSAAMQEAS